MPHDAQRTRQPASAWPSGRVGSILSKATFITNGVNQAGLGLRTWASCCVCVSLFCTCAHAHNMRPIRACQAWPGAHAFVLFCVAELQLSVVDAAVLKLNPARPKGPSRSSPPRTLGTMRQGAERKGPQGQGNGRVASQGRHTNHMRDVRRHLHCTPPHCCRYDLTIGQLWHVQLWPV